VAVLTLRIYEPVPRNDRLAVDVGIDASGERVNPVTVARELGFGDRESSAEPDGDPELEADQEEEADAEADAEGADADADEEAEGDLDARLEADAEAVAEAEPDAEADAETDADKLTKEDPVYFLVALDVADGFREKRELRETGRETSGVREICPENVSCASLLTIDDTSKSMPSFSIILHTLYIITYLNLYV